VVNGFSFNRHVSCPAAQGALRTKETIERFKQVPAQPGQTNPLLVYFGTLLQKGQLNQFESVELSRLVIGQNKKHLLDGWFKEGKVGHLPPFRVPADCMTAFRHIARHTMNAHTSVDLHGSLLQLSPSEQLGDLFKGAGDNATALACYQSTGATVKVVEGASDQLLVHRQNLLPFLQLSPPASFRRMASYAC
jgi:Clathrin-H-link